MHLLLLTAPALALAEDALGCTAFGRVELAGGTRGPIHGPEWTVEVVERAAAIRRRDDVVWEGPAASLAFEPVRAPPVHATTTAAVPPDESTALELSRIVEAQMWAARIPHACLWGGTSTLLVPPWPDPIRLPDRATVAWSTGAEALIVSPTERTWYRAISATPEMAADLSAALSAQRNRAVFWKSDVALAVVSTLPVAGEAIAPAPASQWGWDPYLAGVRSLDRRVDFGPSTLAAGREMVATLNERRAAAGLAPVAWDDKLGWAAMAHCVYVDWTDSNLGEYHGHDQRPTSPVFVGATPWDRGGAWEVVARSRRFPPDAAIDQWLETPFHRTAPMHPRAVRAGACATPGGTRVMEIEIDRTSPAARFVYPTDGMTNVPLAFDGSEEPDPVPLAEYPDKTIPMGFTLSAWFPLGASDSRIADSWILAGRKKVAHYVVARDIAEPDRAIVHLIPKAPLAPNTRYVWGVELDSPPQRIEASFTTGASPFPADAARAPFDAWLEAENQRRDADDLPPLVHSAALDTLAASYRVRHRWPRELTWPANVTIYCSRNDPGGPASMQKEPTSGAPFTRIGFAADASEVCVVAAADPLEPVRAGAP
jgi:uncharacterized protein YkwD